MKKPAAAETQTGELDQDLVLVLNLNTCSRFRRQIPGSGHELPSGGKIHRSLLTHLPHIPHMQTDQSGRSTTGPGRGRFRLLPH